MLFFYTFSVLFSIFSIFSLNYVKILFKKFDDQSDLKKFSVVKSETRAFSSTFSVSNYLTLKRVLKKSLILKLLLVFLQKISFPPFDLN